MSTAATKRFTPAEYLAIERKSEIRSEYLDGVIYAMSGSSRQHSTIAVNLAREVSQRLKGRPCTTFSNDMRVFIPATGLYTYPDLSVACGEARFQDEVFDTLLNPTILFEILSPSTEAYDRGARFRHYRSIESLREFVLISQEAVLVERYYLDAGRWILDEVGRRDGVLRLGSIEAEVPLAEVYDRVAVPDSGPSTQGNGDAQP